MQVGSWTSSTASGYLVAVLLAGARADITRMNLSAGVWLIVVACSCTQPAIKPGGGQLPSVR
jgi:hypothetical protein